MNLTTLFIVYIAIAILQIVIVHIFREPLIRLVKISRNWEYEAPDFPMTEVEKIVLYTLLFIPIVLGFIAYFLYNFA